MKYLDILKDYDKAIVSESKKLDDIYKKLLGESCCDDDGKTGDEGKEKVNEGEKTCDCGKEDCPICGKKSVDENEDKEKQMREFNEGENSDGKSAKKMLSKDEFFGKEDGGDENKSDDGEKKTDDGAKSDDGEKKVDEDDILKGGLHNGHVDENENGEKKTDDGEKTDDGDDSSKTDDGAKADDGEKKVDEGADDNLKMSASDLFSENDDDSTKTDDGANSDDANADDASKADDGEKKVDEANIEKEIKDFFGIKENDDDSTKADDGEKNSDDGEKKTDDGEKTDDGAKADDGEKKVDGDENKSDDGEKKVDENKGLTMKEIMAKESKEKTDDNADAGSDEDAETAQLNESIKAIRQFVKANKKFFG